MSVFLKSGSHSLGSTTTLSGGIWSSPGEGGVVGGFKERGLCHKIHSPGMQSRTTNSRMSKGRGLPSAAMFNGPPQQSPRVWVANIWANFGDDARTPS